MLTGRSVLSSFLLVSCAVAQINASYGPFGTGCSGTGPGLGNTHALPAAMATSFGGSNNAIPFGWYPVKYQQVFLGTDLPNAFTMGGLALRQDEAGFAYSLTVDLEIEVGMTTRGPSTMSNVFAANFDAGPSVIVRPRAQIVFPDQRVPPPAMPSEFFFTIAWPTTFDWVPSPGSNFLVQVTIYGNSHGSQAAGYALDACGGATARLYGSPATATSGTLNPNYGLVMGIVEPIQTAVPLLYSTSTPQIGDTFRVRLAQARPSSFALMLLGLSNGYWAGHSLPLDLGARGAPGCSLLTAVDDAQLVLINSGGTGSYVYSLPNDIYLLGMVFYNQYLVADPPANALGFVTTNGGVGRVGNL